MSQVNISIYPNIWMFLGNFNHMPKFKVNVLFLPYFPSQLNVILPSVCADLGREGIKSPSIHPSGVSIPGPFHPISTLRHQYLGHVYSFISSYPFPVLLFLRFIRAFCLLCSVSLEIDLWKLCFWSSLTNWILLQFDQLGDGGCAHVENWRPEKGDSPGIPSHTGTQILHVYQAAGFCSHCFST